MKAFLTVPLVIFLSAICCLAGPIELWKCIGAVVLLLTADIRLAPIEMSTGLVGDVFSLPPCPSVSSPCHIINGVCHNDRRLFTSVNVANWFTIGECMDSLLISRWMGRDMTLTLV